MAARCSNLTRALPVLRVPVSDGQLFCPGYNS